MSKVSNLFWPAGGKSSAQSPSGPVPLQRSEEPAAKSESTASAGARRVDDHEVLRRLLAETGNQLGAIDNLKDSFSKLVLPLHSLLTTLESEKADNARSQDAFEEIRNNQETLRTELQGLERKSLELERDNDRLRHELETMRRDSHEPDDSAKLANEVEAQRMAMTVIVKRLGEESGNARALSEENAALVKRLENSERRLADMEEQVSKERERLANIEGNSSSLQAALEKAQRDAAYSSRRLGETEDLLAEARKKAQDAENSLAVAEAERNTALAESERLFRQVDEIQGAQTDSSSRVQQLESSLAEAEAERAKLAAARDEAEERRQKESHALRLELHELRQRFHASEQLLSEAQQSAATRAADSAGAEARLLEETVARAEAEKKLAELVAASEGSRQQVQQLECEVVNLTDRCKALAETLAGGETSRTEASDKIKALTSQLEQLQAESTKYRTRAEQVFAQLNATVEHERRERAHMEAALDRARNDYARLQRAVVEERSVRRSDHQRRLGGSGTLN